MGRSSGKERKKVKNGTKVGPAKRSKFSINNNDIFHAPKNPSFGNPTAYLYGNSAIDAKKAKKRPPNKYKNKNKINNKSSSAYAYAPAQTYNNNKSSSFVARKGNKRGKRIFIARFPVVGTKTKAVPWLRRNKVLGKDEKSNQTEGKQQLEKIMNGAFSVNEKAMEYFNAELEEFAEYVKLTQTEIRAREYLIQQIQKSCKNLFGVEDWQCQVFGSFAARPVCIFESDIDLAIWGVVEPDSGDETDLHTKQQQQQESIAKRAVDAQLEADQTISNQRKQERVLKWKALIDNVSKSMEEQTEQLEDKTTEESTTERNAESENVEPPLFVLDHTGDGSADSLDDDDDDGDGHNNGDDDDDNSESDNSNIDNADKLENFWSRKSLDNSSTRNDGTASNPIAIPSRKSRDNSSTRNDGTANNPIAIPDLDDDSSDSTFTDEEKVDLIDIPKRRPRGQSLVSLSSSTTCSVEAKLDESEMEISFFVDPNKQPAREKVGPSGKTRTRVVNSLYKLTRPLRPFASQMHVRRQARVPIINMVTTFGFECDIALGGHNGTDTSSYASTHLSRFKSFASLVVFLKVLLNQQGLDKPFTGGLGSYALYVLVASHIEKHLALGGNDDPAEVLYTFFFRYGGVKHTNSKISSSWRTPLSQDMVIETEDGGSVNMKSYFQIDNCITVFENCWRILQKRLSGKCNQKFSILQYMIDAVKLEIGRSQCKKQADSKLRQVLGGRMHQKSASYSTHTTAVAGLPRQEEKKDSSGDLEARGDLEAQDLIKGYGQSVERFMPVEEFSKKRKAAKTTRKKRYKSM